MIPCCVHVSRGPSKADRAKPSARKGMKLFLETYGRFTIRIPHQIDASDSLFLAASIRLAELFSTIEQQERRTCRGISLSVAGQALAVVAAGLQFSYIDYRLLISGSRVDGGNDVFYLNQQTQSCQAADTPRRAIFQKPY